MIPTELNENHVPLINLAIKSAFPENSWTHEKTLSQGNSPSVLYILNIKNKKFVAKLTDPNYPGSNLSTVYDAQIKGFNNKIAPRVYYSDPSAGILIMDHIEAVPFDKINHEQPETIEKLAKLLNRLHLCDDFQKGLSSFERVDFRHNLIPLNFKSHHLIKQAIQAKETIQKILIDDEDIKPSHGDLSPFNLLFDGSYFLLVDWDTATQDNLYFDLATCLIFFYFNNEEASEIFLQNYFGRSPSQAERDKLDLMKIFVYIYYGITFVYTSSLRKVELFSQEAIETLPSYSEFMKSIGSGKVNLGNGKSQQQLGFIYLKVVEVACSSEVFKNSITRLNPETPD